MQDAGRDSIIFIGTDATSAQQDAIRDGAEVGTLSQKPYEIGYQTILAALQTTTEDSFSSKQTTLFDPAWIDTTALAMIPITLTISMSRSPRIAGFCKVYKNFALL